MKTTAYNYDDFFPKITKIQAQGLFFVPKRLTFHVKVTTISFSKRTMVRAVGGSAITSLGRHSPRSFTSRNYPGPYECVDVKKVNNNGHQTVDVRTVQQQIKFLHNMKVHILGLRTRKQKTL